MGGKTDVYKWSDVKLCSSVWNCEDIIVHNHLDNLDTYILENECGMSGILGPSGSPALQSVMEIMVSDNKWLFHP